jgi:hypothetical protein
LKSEVKKISKAVTEVQKTHEGLKVYGIYNFLFFAYDIISLDENKNAIRKYVCVNVSVTGCRTKPQYKDS